MQYKSGYLLKNNLLPCSLVFFAGLCFFITCLCFSAGMIGAWWHIRADAVFFIRKFR